ncbi:MAG: cysteine desulfurase family protein [Planctomycetota bacterium]
MREIYLDNHATTRTDPRVVEAMLPVMLDDFANPGSSTHEPGRRAAARIDACRESIARRLNTEPDAVVFTSGATESINLALLGAALHPRQKRRKIISTQTEHRAALDTLNRLQKLGFEVVYLDVETRDPARIGQIDIHRLQQHVDENTAIVSIMLGNNEIGTIEDLQPIAECCHEHGALFHTDATQSIGKIPIDIQRIEADLLSFSAHKFYGPRGVGGLIINQQFQPVLLQPQIIGGGQQQNLRSGTLNSAGIVGMATALEIAICELAEESNRTAKLREQLWSRLTSQLPEIQLNGPTWNRPLASQLPNRLPGNLNILFPKVEGQSMMLRLPRLAVSSGSACTSATPHPSHVLLAIGRTEDEARSSLRFGIGRFNTESEIEESADWILEAYSDLVALIA